MKSHRSPCIDMCNFSGLNGWCSGCGRTREECKKWKKMKPYKKNIVQKELKNRLFKIKTEHKNNP